ncbi:AbrB/MazE/SpoVT family DNA-binding domain-containing protein [Bacillus haynesii]|uniref:AbrB/MazE/SpoVT family DNA-binding domain-containing protein n=1 Tax=Bacillus TaxID=1386 RepID=UPI00227EFB9A|nr:MULTISPECIES: AbrB/MazE/SpoVT family DNA-binding domain-containing protein [Bacillus]MCY7773463.1 AbrB/MazE/SpoVT family DNA-binding domain-containing protein [Bacillus licheniformis]MCY8021513.1 AbrB/MazE/SpoVT family DNA-binding domain-containing protein [Bacillus licheniformis]MCY8530055.1 AbrB/MazE/SpoVT family DNA-binding domain-containing protein [Bacillus licheniformis]MCY9266906.1 AbrB/MazE/SpoVT family DNA-binding domain-containing protein [Bacillus licheniformis]MCY9288270.1 AbrB/
MKSATIVRKVDDLGRVVLPRSIRRILELNGNDPVEYFVEGENIIIRKYLKDQICVVTGEMSDKNVTVSGGIVLSPEGARILLQDLLAGRLNDEF